MTRQPTERQANTPSWVSLKFLTTPPCRCPRDESVH